MNTKGLGKDQKAAVDFYSRYSGWQSFAGGCRATVRIVESLVRRGLLESIHKTLGIYQARLVENSEK